MALLYIYIMNLYQFVKYTKLFIIDHQSNLSQLYWSCTKSLSICSCSYYCLAIPWYVWSPQKLAQSYLSTTSYYRHTDVTVCGHGSTGTNRYTLWDEVNTSHMYLDYGQILLQACILEVCNLCMLCEPACSATWKMHGPVSMYAGFYM